MASVVIFVTTVAHQHMYFFKSTFFFNLIISCFVFPAVPERKDTNEYVSNFLEQLPVVLLVVFSIMKSTCRME